MEVTPPQQSEESVVSDVVGRSLRASYALSPAEIDAVTDRLYSADRLVERSEDPDTRLVVARRDDAVVGAAEGRLALDGDVGVVDWLHVDPPERGQGVGTELFEDLRASLTDDGADELRARIFASNAEGAPFLERFGLTRLAQDRIDVGIPGDPYILDVYSDRDESEDADCIEPAEVPEQVTVGDETYRADATETRSGTEGPFLLIYEESGAGEGSDGAQEARPTDGDDADDGEGDLVGYYCTSCGNLVDTMGSLGGLECEQCGNTHRQDSWDGAYL